MPGYYSEEEEDTTFGRKNQPLARYWTWIFFWHLNLTIAKKIAKPHAEQLNAQKIDHFLSFWSPKNK